MSTPDRTARLAELLEEFYIVRESGEYDYRPLFAALDGDAPCPQFFAAVVDRHDHYYGELVDTIEAGVKFIERMVISPDPCHPMGVHDLDTGVDHEVIVRVELAS